MRCLICHEEIVPMVTWDNFWQVPEKEKICSSCATQLKKVEHPGCPICYRPDAQGICYDCERWQKTHPGLLEKNVSIYTYNEFAKDFVARWKYRGDYVLIEALEREIIRAFHQQSFASLPVVSIPLSTERERERGFNQADTLIRVIGKTPLRLLERTGTEKQSKKGRKDRVGSHNPFLLTKEVREPVVLVDDIYTTGTTIRHVASLLKQGGCPKIYSFTLFR